VGYAKDGNRFLGATFDVSPLYRFNAVQDWLTREGLSVDKMLAHVRRIERVFLQEIATLHAPIDASLLLVPDEAMRGRFLAFRTANSAAITARLAAKNVIVDHRGDRLRIGFGIYHDEDDARKLARAMAD
jgi:kynureninase